ncbi:MAG: acyl-CoA thioesterase [Sphingobacteriaceae bacterium]|nr:acyl-CoA thioesterase [Sphingobacteriaceae bacterium]
MLMNLNLFNYKTYIPVRFGDLNAFGFVNHDIYLTYFEIAHTEYWKKIIQWESKSHGIIIGKVEINFIKPIEFVSEVYAYVRTARIGNCSFDVEYVLTIMNPEGEIICTTGKTECVFYDFAEAKPAAIPDVQREKMIAFEALSEENILYKM